MTLLILFVYQSQGEKHRWPQDSTVAKGLQADGLTTGSDQKPLLHKWWVSSWDDSSWLYERGSKQKSQSDSDF